MKQKLNPYVELLIKKIKLENEMSSINKAFNKYLIEEDIFKKKVSSQLTSSELDVVKEYYLEGKTIQKISNESGTPYTEVRKNFLNGSEKLNMIARFLDE